MISIITPIYDLDEHFKDYVNFIGTLMKKGGNNVVKEIILINNNPKKKISKTILKSLKIPKLFVIQNKKNLGYGKACNQGLRLAKGKYYLILNPDVTIDALSLKKLMMSLDKNKNAKMVSCSLLNEDGSLQVSCRRFPTFTALLARRVSFPFATIFRKELRRYNMNDYNRKTARKVDWVSGAVMLMNEKYYFDKNYFMYFEDVDLCRTLGMVYYYPEIKAIHKSERESARNVFLFFSHVRSMLYYFYKFGVKKRF